MNAIKVVRYWISSGWELALNPKFDIAYGYISYNKSGFLYLQMIVFGFLHLHVIRIMAVYNNQG